MELQSKKFREERKAMMQALTNQQKMTKNREAFVTWLQNHCEQLKAKKMLEL